MNDSNKSIGLLIKLHRTQLGLTQEELSKLLNFETPQFVSNMERGIAKIPFNVLGRLIHILNLPEDKIIEIMTSDFRTHLTYEIKRTKKG